MNDYGRAFLCGRRAGCPDDCFPGLNMKRLAFFAVALFSVSAHAAISPAGPAVEVLPGNGYRILQGASLNATAPLSRSIVGSSAGVTVTDTINVAGKAGNMAVQVGRLASHEVLGAALARSLPLVSTAVAVVSLLNDLRVKDGMRDPGQSSILITDDNWCVYGKNDSSGNPLYCGTSAQQAETKYEDWWKSYKTSTQGSYNPTCGYTNGQPVYGTWSVVSDGVSSDGTAYYYKERRVCNGPTSYYDSLGSWSIVTKRASKTRNGCPKIIDSLTGQLYEPGLSGDGKCLTGRYTNPVAESDIIEGTARLVSTSSGQTSLSDIAKALLAAGLTIGTNPADTPVKSLTGPASQTGTPTSSTTTGPTGTVQTTTTPTYNYTYQGDTITYNITNTTTTTTTNTSGQTTTTTTTETRPTEEPADGMCKLYPDSLACQKVGDPPNDEIPKTDRTVSVAQESVSLPEGCPADIPLPGGNVLSYASACDAAQKIRPVVIAAGVLSALLIAVAALRR